MQYTHKKITYDRNHVTGGHVKRWQLYNDEQSEFVDAAAWRMSPLPDTTERDTFGGIVANYNN